MKGPINCRVDRLTHTRTLSLEPKIEARTDSFHFLYEVLVHSFQHNPNSVDNTHAIAPITILVGVGLSALQNRHALRDNSHPLLIGDG